MTDSNATRHDATFAEWLEQLTLYIESRGHKHVELDAGSWRADYDAGITPREAFRQDWWRNPFSFRLTELWLGLSKQLKGESPPE